MMCGHQVTEREGRSELLVKAALPPEPEADGRLYWSHESLTQNLVAERPKYEPWSSP